MKESDVLVLKGIGFALLGYAARGAGDWFAAFFFLGSGLIYLLAAIMQSRKEEA